MRFKSCLAIALVIGACSSSADVPRGGRGADDPTRSSSDGGARTGSNDDGGSFDEGVNPCTSPDNPAGSVKELSWPAASNTGHTIGPGETLRFKWTGTHSVVQVADWEGTPIDAKIGRRVDSGAPTNDGSFDWNVGTFSCGYRPGLYYLAQETPYANNPACP